jgi:hypothetical protein
VKAAWQVATTEELDQLARTADVASERADGFAERADLDVHAAMAAEMIDGAAAAAAEDAGGVGVVHHHDAVEFLGEVAELGQRGDVAFHGKDAVGDQELLAGPVLSFCEDALAVGEVLVLEDLDGALRKAAAVNDGGVVQLV